MTLLTEHLERQAMSHLPRLKRYDSELRFAALLTAVSCSRLFAKYTLQAWKLGHLVETAELLVSELVTNAVKATGITDPHPRWTDLDNLQLIALRLHRNADSVFIEVWDSDPTPPVMSEQNLDDEHGRGLFLVASMSSRWNYYHARNGGKVVWCELPLHTPGNDKTLETRPVLARRVRRPVPPPAEPLRFMTDIGLLRRVHEGLKRLGNDSEGGSAMR